MTTMQIRVMKFEDIVICPDLFPGLLRGRSRPHKEGCPCGFYVCYLWVK